MSDRALVRRLLAGEESAFEEFFAEYFPRLFRFACARAGGDEDLAEDAVQAALVRAIEKLHTYRGEAALFTWLCTICRHQLADLQRRAGRTAAVLLSEDAPDIRAALESVTGQEEVSRLVQVTLDHLPARYGDVLEWKYIDGLAVDEIAQRLGVGYKVAESTLTRARQAFRELFLAALPQKP